MGCGALAVLLAEKTIGIGNDLFLLRENLIALIVVGLSLKSGSPTASFTQDCGDFMEPVEFEKGEFVIIESPNFFRGVKSAIYLNPCKIHDGGHECYLTNKTSITKLVCVQPGVLGNSMVRLADLAGS